MSKIKGIKAREILASGGSPTLEVEVILESGATGEASVSYGVSAGTKEATVLLDGDKARYNGKGMMNAVNNVMTKIAPAVIGMTSDDQRAIDEKLLELDGTENKSNLGGNAILAVSMAVARAQAKEMGLPLYEYLRKAYGIEMAYELPKPMVVMIEGGKHADETTDLQEFLISALGERSVKEEVRMEAEIYEALKKILKREGLSINVGNEGAFAPNGIATNEKPLEYFLEAIKNAGYKPGVDAGISIDAAASEFASGEPKSGISYELKIEGKKLSSAQLIDYFMKWVEKYPFVSFEDMLSEFDWEFWPVLQKKLMESGKNINLIADDITVTNKKLLQKMIDVKGATGILIKLNQAGTVTETVDTCLLANENDFWTVVSHRGGGESNDTFMVDLAVAVNSKYIKCGITRGERVCKYNRLMLIEEMLNEK